MTALYLWGKPIATQLTISNRPSPQLLILNSPIRDISCGDNHCVVVTEEGAFGVGDNSEGQLGMRSVKNTGFTLAKIQFGFNSKIIEVSCGWHHTLLLDQNGNVFSSGRGDNGELGCENVRSKSSFGFVLSGARQISAGKDHSLALCGLKVYGWGNSKEGQLGLLIQKQYYRPQELNVYPCYLILAAQKYSLFVTSKGIFGTGLNTSWQLGLGHSNSVQVPRKIAIEEEIVYLSAGSYTVAGTIDKQWYLWGVGALGCFKYPTKMSFLSGAESVTIGPSAGTFSKKGRIWVWGSNSWGELGHQPQVYDYPVQSEEFSRMALSGCQFGINFFAAYSNSEPCYCSKYSEENSCYESDLCLNMNNKRMKNSGSSDDLNQSPAFDRYCNKGGHGKDPINEFPEQLKRRLYSDQSLVSEDKSGMQTSYATMSNTQPQTPKGWFPKKYVKLINPVKSINGSRKEQLQKQNRELRQRLEFEQFQKDKIEQQYMKRINCYDKQFVSNKINQLEKIANPRHKWRREQSPILTSSRKEAENISFRPKVIEGTQLQEMGCKIETLKGLLTDMVK